METPTCLTPKATRSTVRSSQQWDDVGEVCVTVDPDEVSSISFSAMQNPKPADIIGMFSSFLSIIPLLCGDSKSRGSRTKAASGCMSACDVRARCCLARLQALFPSQLAPLRSTVPPVELQSLSRVRATLRSPPGPVAHGGCTGPSCHTLVVPSLATAVVKLQRRSRSQNSIQVKLSRTVRTFSR